jgi:hypothetical protein
LPPGRLPQLGSLRDMSTRQAFSERCLRYSRANLNDDDDDGMKI